VNEYSGTDEGTPSYTPDASKCFDGIDNDIDNPFGKYTLPGQNIDCGDSDCAAVSNPSNSTLSCYGTEFNLGDNIQVCNDAFDNDGDLWLGWPGGQDCTDADCNAQFGNCGPCPSVENITYDSCADSIDTDYDGSTNCADADCSGELGNTTGSQRCGSENSNSACKDGFDNDADGLIDCKDPGCVGFTGPHGQTCQASESNCNDNFDNDADTYIDCFDTDCYANSACRISLVAAVSSFTVPAYDFNPPGSLFPGTSTLREYQLSHLYVDRNHTMTFTGSSSYSSSYTYIGSVSDLYIYNFSSCRIVGPSANNFTKIDSGDFGYIRNNASGTFSNFNFTLECETFTQPKAPDSFNVLASSAFSAGGKDEGSRDFSSTLHENTQPVVNAILVEPSAAGTVDIRYGGYVGIVANATDPGTGLYTSNISVCYFNIAGAGYTAQNDGLCRYKYQTYADASAITVQSYAIDGSNNTGSPYASGSFDINIMPILSDPLLLNKVKPFFKSAETIGLNVSFITASNGNFGSSVCAVTVIDSSGSVVSSSSLTPSAAGNTILCSGSITAPVGDDMYEVYVNVTDEDTDMAKSNEKAFYVCDSLSSSGAGWTCAKADFDQDGAAEGLFTTVNFRGLTMPCDNCPAEYNPEQYDFNANGVGELCEGPPRGSIVIYGNNGTEVTGSRNVFLNLSSVDMFGVEKCRFANDNESDLASAPWENCTTVKAWILSEGEGVKTVYYQMLNVISLTTTLNDSILYRFMQDFTAPTPPTVYDSTYGYDIDWWNSNTTLGAYWFNATEDLSNTIYYKYRIFENDSCYAGDCGWTDAGTSSDVNVTGLSLFEGYNYSFEVLAYTVSGLNSSGMSNGTFIDITMPGAPIINSTTHPSQDVTYGNNTVRFNFTAMDPLSNGVASGIEGYSYVLDSYPGTAPDDDMEDRQWSMMNRLRNSGASQLLREDETSSTPNTYAVFSQLKENFTENDSIRVRVALGEQPSDYDDPMGIKVYLMRVNDGVAISQFDGELDAITAVINTTRDVRYSYDLAGAAIYEFVLTVNTSVNDAVSDTYVVVSGVISDNDNRNNLSIAASILGFDNSTRNFVCNDSNSCTETTSVLDYAVEVAKEDSGDVWDVEYDSVDDGAFYFHVKAKDFAGNWGDPSHFKVNIETFGVSVELISPFTGQLFNTPNITAAVEVNKEANVSIIVVYQNGSGFNSSSVITNGTAEFNITLKEGINRVYAVAVNTKNGIVSYSDSAYVRFGLAVVHVDRTLRIMYPGTACSGHMCVLTEGGLVNIGIASENDSAVFGSNSINSDTGVHTLKIFATNPLMDSSGVEADLDDDEFLDRENPMFGFKKGTPYYIVRTEMRPSYAYLSGSRRMGAGNYVIVFRNVGTAPDGKTNISVVIR